MGTRRETGKDESGAPIVGDYQWETYKQVDEDVRNLANGMISLELAPEVDGEGKKWRFVGMMSQNRAEWVKVLLASMHYNTTTVGFYDAMSHDQVNYILNQTQMSTIFCTANYANKVLDMMNKG